MSVTVVDKTRALSFGARAAEYERHRPGYCAAALDLVTASGPARAVDVGAGTGKLTRSLLDRGWGVLAVEPDPGMRDVLEQSVPQATVRAGRAEELPVADGSAELITFGQSWHWTDHGPAAAEAARVLVPGGTLVMLWNYLDTRHDWVAALQDAEGLARPPTEPTHMNSYPGFGPGVERVVDWAEQRTEDDYVDLAQTYSHVAMLDASGREKVSFAIRSVLQDQPRDGAGLITIPQHCTVWRYPRV